MGKPSSKERGPLRGTWQTENIEKIILDYLESHNTLSLATEKDGQPHAATVFYLNVGFELFFLSSPTSRHGDNLSHNARASATINEDYSNWLDIKGIQMEGTVKKMGGILENRRLALAYVGKFPVVADFVLAPKKLGRAIAQKVADVRLYSMEPSTIYFVDNEKGFGHRDELVLVNGSIRR